MKQFLVIITILCGLLPVYAYENTRLQKLDNVNSYQPLQFVTQGYYAEPLVKSDKIDLKFQTNIKNAYLETCQLEETEQTPLSKDLFIEENIQKPQSSYAAMSRYNTPNPVLISEDEANEFEMSLLQKEKRTLTAHQRWDKFWFWLKGEQADDAILLGMQSVHTSEQRHERNNSNKGIGLQYGGVAAGYFYNSWYRDTYYLTVARRVWKKRFLKDWQIDLQYKAGVMHGYKEEAPIQLGFIEPLVVPAIGISYKKVGTDIWIIPSSHPVFAANIRIGLPNAWEYKTIHTNIQRKKEEYEKLNPPVSNIEYEKITPQIEEEIDKL